MPHIVVAVPVRDEASLIPDCLRALALQQGGHRAEVLLLVNNSSDGTADIARGLRPTLPCPVHVLEHRFPPAEASAGHARRLAMSKAAMLTSPGGIVMTTDADSCVPPDWLEANMAAIEAGADVVCGRAVIDPVDALQIPRHLHDDDAHEVTYQLQLEQIACLLDPDPADPWPRHAEESGASIAVRVEAFTSAGGVPPISAGEDRALVDALRRGDARIRHAPDVWVNVSGRIVGRARDGMADTIRRRIGRQDLHVDGSMEPVAARVRRIGARRLLRLAWGSVVGRSSLLGHLARDLQLPQSQLEGWMALPAFGAAWAVAERASPTLERRPVARVDLSAQIRVAEGILASLVGATVRIGPEQPG